MVSRCSATAAATGSRFIRIIISPGLCYAACNNHLCSWECSIHKDFRNSGNKPHHSISCSWCHSRSLHSRFWPASSGVWMTMIEPPSSLTRSSSVSAMNSGSSAASFCCSASLSLSLSLSLPLSLFPSPLTVDVHRCVRPCVHRSTRAGAQARWHAGAGPRSVCLLYVYVI